MFDEHEHVIFGYGSLLSHDSRFRHSSIDTPGLAVTLSGWKRSWVTRSTPEKQTYVGAKSCSKSKMNGLLLPLQEIDEDLQKREQDYRFVALDVSMIDIHDRQHEAHLTQLTAKQIWMCETLDTTPADVHHPVYQSYVDTCLVGCLEAGGESFALSFIESTHLWEVHWVNDRRNPFYPRAAMLSKEQQQAIDKLLSQLGLLEMRKSS